MRAVLAVAALVAAAGLAVAFSASAGPSRRWPLPAQSESAVVWAVGDAATPGERADRVAALVRRADPDRFLYLGDVYETGTAKEFRQWYHPRFGRLARITSPTSAITSGTSASRATTGTGTAARAGSCRPGSRPASPAGRSSA